MHQLCLLQYCYVYLNGIGKPFLTFAYYNRELSLLTVVMLLEAGLAKLPRIKVFLKLPVIFWKCAISYVRLRQWGVIK